MARKRRPTHRQRRTIAEYFAFGVSGLIILIFWPAVWGISVWIFEVTLEEHYYDAEILVLPIAGLCAVIGFFGISLALTKGPLLAVLIALFSSKPAAKRRDRGAWR